MASHVKNSNFSSFSLSNSQIGILLGTPQGPPGLGLYKALEEGLKSLVDRINEDCEIDLTPTARGLLRVCFFASEHLTIPQIQHCLSQILGETYDSKSTTTATRLFKKISGEVWKEYPLSRGAERLYNPVILILDKHFHDLPIESIPILRNNPVCRMPSMVLIQSRISESLMPGSSGTAMPKPSVHRDGIQLGKTFYMLNPDGSIPETQDTLLQTMGKLKFTKGLVGAQKNNEIILKQFKTGLTQNDLFIYCGHNAGEQ